LRTVNAKGEANYGTKDGFAPTHRVADNIIPYKAFGDPQETYLQVALGLISGSASSARMGGGALEVIGQGGFDNPRNNIRDMYWDIKQ
jgi:carboxyl-terminal processing protease